MKPYVLFDLAMVTELLLFLGLKLDVTDCETFEGSHLIKWVAKTLGEDDQLKMQLTEQDLR